ncbi:GntR family transcriptional regulator [Herbivorax sp. ANBcel31]|uniref:GntR family transcriptional regulator n=1 Tax=Herbivorax sp. ANBcel31 TaxID=3069754 RepID=UPI0027B27216|nr:GntR family transcriptional regulator [Herbivorax sp. ANBcel31]MDQ2087196.1 GntR family transcriptional regulator [Herbivorax sp. ANBcel31]
MINKYSDVPLYVQLKNLIIDKIEDGNYPPDSKIPSEQEFCELYSISRPTIRQAISELTNNGYLYKEKGKGTFVSRPKASIDVRTYTGFTDSILDNELTDEREILCIETLQSKDLKKVSEIFKVSSNQNIEFAKVIFRTRHGDDVFSFNTSFIPLSLFPDIIGDIDKKKASYDILRGKYPLIPVKSKSSLEVIFTDPKEAQYLMVQPGHALLEITNTLTSKSGQVVEHIISKYRSDKCKLAFDNAKL